VIIKFKKLNRNAIIPTYAHPDDAGLDLYSIENYDLNPGEQHVFCLGFAAEFEEDYTALVWDKGGMAFKNSVHVIGGVFDAGYRGEYRITMINLSNKICKIQKGDKIAQLLIQPILHAKIIQVNKLSKTQRGEGAYGSTG
jgi:dUTP pyrophosphatase